MVAETITVRHLKIFARATMLLPMERQTPFGLLHNGLRQLNVLYPAIVPW
ncbi:hypothetical protein SAMN02746098_01952 [Desulfosporosinus lacus DSM 15449]|uniref:Uncharacterized protein n=1 Tax=Desulfosporosinus lacus DSM 15449 TaxID=1121420 RepID=A0A1M5XE59_9FIRM|nr:hypothetical protein SAMN02746098_01952 [Desulfosporosinus lacus DSM 15449]